MSNGTTVPKGTGGAWHTAADGQPQGDGRIYVAGDSPWFAPILFERDGSVTPGQGGQNNPFHADLKLASNPNGDGSVRFENVRDWSAFYVPGGGGQAGATPQAPYSSTATQTASDYATLKAAILNLGRTLGLE